MRFVLFLPTFLGLTGVLFGSAQQLCSVNYVVDYSAKVFMVDILSAEPRSTILSVGTRFTRNTHSVVWRSPEIPTFEFTFTDPVFVNIDGDLVLYENMTDPRGAKFFNIYTLQEDNPSWQKENSGGDLFDPNVEPVNGGWEFHFNSLGAQGSGKIGVSKTGVMLIELKERTFYDTYGREILPIPIATISYEHLDMLSQNIVAQVDQILGYYADCPQWVARFGNTTSYQTNPMCLDRVPFPVHERAEQTQIGKPNKQLHNDLQPVTELVGRAVLESQGPVSIKYRIEKPGIYHLSTTDVEAVSDGIEYKIRSFHELNTTFWNANPKFNITWKPENTDGTVLDHFQERTMTYNTPSVGNEASSCANILCGSVTAPFPISPFSAAPVMGISNVPNGDYVQLIPDLQNPTLDTEFAFETIDMVNGAMMADAQIDFTPPVYDNPVTLSASLQTISGYRAILDGFGGFMIRSAAEQNECGGLDFDGGSLNQLCTTEYGYCMPRLHTKAYEETGKFFSVPAHTEKINNIFTGYKEPRFQWSLLENSDTFTTTFVPDLAVDVTPNTDVTIIYPEGVFEVLEPFLFQNKSAWALDDISVIAAACNSVVWIPTLEPYNEQTGDLVIPNIVNAGTGTAEVILSVTCNSKNVIYQTTPITITLAEGLTTEVRIPFQVANNVNFSSTACSVSMDIKEKPLWETNGKHLNCPESYIIETYHGLFTPPCELRRPDPNFNITSAQTRYLLRDGVPTKFRDFSIQSLGLEPERLIRMTTSSTRCMVHETSNQTVTRVRNDSVAYVGTLIMNENDETTCDFIFDTPKQPNCEMFVDVASIAIAVDNQAVAETDADEGTGASIGIGVAVASSLALAGVAAWFVVNKRRNDKSTGRGSLLSLSGYTHESMCGTEDLMHESAEGQYRKLTRFKATRHAELCLLNANDKEVIVCGTIVGRHGESMDIVIDDMKEIFLDRENDDVWVETDRSMYFLDKPQAEYTPFFISLKTDLKQLLTNHNSITV
eukprot:CFRG2246T1